MLLEELQSGDIMYMSLLKYANENGGIDSWYYFLSQNLADPSIPMILTWTHSSTKPTIDDLLNYNVSDLDSIRSTLKGIQSVVDSNFIIPCLSSSAIDLSTNDITRNGIYVFDLDLQKIRVFYNGVWNN